MLTSLKFTAFLFPLLLVGTGLGNRMADNIKHEPFRKNVFIINLVVGLTVVITVIVE